MKAISFENITMAGKTFLKATYEDGSAAYGIQLDKFIYRISADSYTKDRWMVDEKQFGVLWAAIQSQPFETLEEAAAGLVVFHTEHVRRLQRMHPETTWV